MAERVAVRRLRGRQHTRLTPAGVFALKDVDASRGAGSLPGPLTGGRDEGDIARDRGADAEVQPLGKLGGAQRGDLLPRAAVALEDVGRAGGADEHAVAVDRERGAEPSARLARVRGQLGRHGPALGTVRVYVDDAGGGRAAGFGDEDVAGRDGDAAAEALGGGGGRDEGERGPKGREERGESNVSAHVNLPYRETDVTVANRALGRCAVTNTTFIKQSGPPQRCPRRRGSRRRRSPAHRSRRRSRARRRRNRRSRARASPRDPSPVGGRGTRGVPPAS